LGRRGDVTLIRQGMDEAVVSAEFCIKNNPLIANLLFEHGLPGASEENAYTLVFRRILSRKSSGVDHSGAPAGGGRSRAFINDQMISIGLLRLLGDSLLEIHGQFDRLLEPASYRTLLDEFAVNQEQLRCVANAHHIWRNAHNQWQEADSHLKTLQQNEEFLKQQLADLKKLGLTTGEEESLLKEREGLAYAGKLSETVRDVKRHLLAGSLEVSLHSAVKALQRVQGQGGGKIDAACGAVERALTELVEAQAQIQDVSDQLAGHPHRLQAIDERLYVLRAAARKYNVGSDALTGLQTGLEEQLASLDQAGDRLGDHVQTMNKAWTAYCAQALTLHQRRKQAAEHLEKAVMNELPALKLPHSRFSAHMDPLPEKQWNESGMDRVDFMVAMNNGQELCSLSKSASGGELARLMLALKVALASRSSIPTIIFDEIDTGVGGAVAAAIGDRLATLATHVQVLAITHSPQMAACAQHHFLVFKQHEHTFTRTSVELLSSQNRQDELARMLSGAEITPEARAAAARMLKHS
jgi:DNA repair protein RecN (Recombination protein N)